MLEQYHLALLALGLVALLMIIQLAVYDVAAILKKHQPGSPIENNHQNFLFRANRAHLNINESIAIFICSLAFAIAVKGDTQIVNYAAITYFISRFVYTLCYYANLKILRSVLFGVSFVSLIAINLAGFIALGTQ